MEAAILLSHLHKYFSYDQYRDMVIDFAEKGMTTGFEQEQKQIDATKINAQRMKRIDKQAVLTDTIKEELTHLKNHWIWIVLAESWCGDGAQNLPFINKMAALTPKIELRIILRDEHSEIMNEFLTKGTRSVPKLICICAETRSLVGSWGPRSKAIQEKVLAFKSEHPEVSHEKFVEKLHGWYAQDKGEALMRDFEILLKNWNQPAYQLGESA